jgi:CheY-like chemotaxis protein
MQRRPKILVLDDSATVLEITESMLSAGGYDVVTVESWPTLAKTLTREQPDLLLIDVSMPVLRGDSIVQAMSRGGGTRVPLVLYSDQPAAALDRLARTCGASGYICKTSEPAVLLQAVAKFLPLPSASPLPVIALFSDDALLAAPAGLKLVKLGQGAAARAAFEQLSAPSLVLIDLDAPGAESAARELRATERGRALPLVALSASDGPLELRRLGRMFADDFMLKRRLGPELEARLRAPTEPVVSAPLVLVADGDPLTRARVVRLCECCGFSVAVASTAGELNALVASRALELRAALVDGAWAPDLAGLAKALRGGGRATLVLLQEGAARLPIDSPAVAAFDKFNLSDGFADFLLGAVTRSTSLRIANRAPFFSRVEFQTPGGEWRSGFSLEASANGLFITTLLPASAGAELTLRLFSSGRQLIECRGRVVWSKPLASPREVGGSPGMAVEFLSLTGGVGELLSRHTALGGPTA